MIFPNEKATIIKYLGIHNSRKIIPFLDKQGIRNARGGSYSPKSIQNIVNGDTDNVQVEMAIFQLVEIKRKERVQLENMKKQLS